VHAGCTKELNLNSTKELNLNVRIEFKWCLIGHLAHAHTRTTGV
jgi:hypothetical protein